MIGLLGYPLHHSLSPIMHNTGFKAVGKEANYVLLPTEKDKLTTALAAAKADGFSGLNVTIPYKEEIVPYLDRLTPEAERIGAVNTIAIVQQGAKKQMVGHNTDGLGFVEAYR